MIQKLSFSFSFICLGLMACVTTAQAQTANTYPNKPVKVVVGFAPGGAADYVARTISDSLGKSLGQPVIIENKAGAGSSIAAEAVSKSAPDGYTVLIASPSSISVNPALNPKLGYAPKDLFPVTKITTSPLVIAANPNAGIGSLLELVAKAKKSPGTINYATSGNGSAPHLGAALFAQVTGIEMTHIPFRGGGPAIQSVVAGDTQLTFGTPPSVLPMVQAGRLKIEFWYGIFVPNGTPPAVVKKIFDAAQFAMSQPNVKTALAREGTDVDVSKSPDQFASFLTEDAKFWVKLVKSAGVKLD